MTEGTPLAAIITNTDADTAIASLKAEGVYDSDRHIRSRDEDHLALPVTAQPASTPIVELIEQADPDWRIHTLTDRLRRRGWSREALEAVPNSWAVIGSVIIGRFETTPNPEVVGEELLDLHGAAETVISLQGINDASRTPDIEILAGTGETETVHVEHGTSYALDLAEVMFSPGNKTERARMGEVVSANECIFDMFAGIGYFTLPMARAGAHVIAAERNPPAYDYLCENIRRNDVTDLVTPHLTDCRDLDVTADRIVMGHYDAPNYLESALAAIRPGGQLHLHGLAPTDDPWDALHESLAKATDSRGQTFSITGRRVVKTHSPGMDHVVIDAIIE